jgi:PhnB protein
MKKAMRSRPPGPKRGKPLRVRPEAARAAQPATPAGGRATPYLIIKDAARAVDFYRKAFDATEVIRLQGADGRIAHCEIKIGEASILLADEWEGVGATSPSVLGGSPVIIHLEVDDVDTIAKQAIDAGAKVIFPVQDQFYGERAGRVQDPFGHLWLLSTKIESVPAPEMRKPERSRFRKNSDK